MKTRSVIFSGFKIPWHLFYRVPNKEQFDVIQDGDVYVGKVLVENSLGSEFSIELIRDYSTNDEVRYLRTELRKLDESYNDIYPKLYLITKKE